MTSKEINILFKSLGTSQIKLARENNITASLMNEVVSNKKHIKWIRKLLVDLLGLSEKELWPEVEFNSTYDAISVVKNHTHYRIIVKFVDFEIPSNSKVNVIPNQFRLYKDALKKAENYLFVNRDCSENVINYQTAEVLLWF